MKLEKKHHSIGSWYYQQLLKYAFSVIDEDYEYYLIWDADTIPLRNFDLFENDKIVFTQGRELHSDYFMTFDRLFDSKYAPNNVSHIAQHMLIRREDMRELLFELGARGLPWWQHIMASLVPGKPQQFSEYETYAADCLARWPDRYVSRSRPWFRFAASLCNSSMDKANLEWLGKFYDYAAFETWDAGSVMRLRSWLVFAYDRIIRPFIKNSSA
jgi:hypothetical protein